MAKKFCAAFLCVSLCLLLLCAGIVFAVDPFSHYRADADLTRIIYQSPMYQNVGIARHAQYDTLITGSSMTQNFRAWWFDEATGCRAVRLSYDGGYLPDFVTLLKTAAKYQPKLRDVYFGLDNYVVTADSELADKGEMTPSYLTDDNPLTDVRYLLNRDVLFGNVRTYFAYRSSPDYDFYEMHAWGAVERDPAVFNRANALSTYAPPENDAPPLEEDAFSDAAREAADALSEIVRQNPQIRFTFFAPPYSILYWKDLQHNGKLDATLRAMRDVYETLMQYDNVRLFYFQNDWQRITDLDNYKDFSHYCTDYNRYMLDCFVRGEKELDAAQCGAVLDEMKRAVSAYDESGLFETP